MFGLFKNKFLSGADNADFSYARISDAEMSYLFLDYSFNIDHFLKTDSMKSNISKMLRNTTSSKCIKENLLHFFKIKFYEFQLILHNKSNLSNTFYL